MQNCSLFKEDTNVDGWTLAMAVEFELNRLPDLSEKNHKASQLSSIPFLAEPCSYDQVIFGVLFLLQGSCTERSNSFFHNSFLKINSKKPDHVTWENGKLRLGFDLLK